MERTLTRPRRVHVLMGLGLIVMLFTAWTEATTPVAGPHSRIELALLRNQIQGLEVYFGQYFVTAGRCAGCHGHDSLGIAMIAGEDEDVNVADDWRSTMMGNSARDPFFRAKIEHETLVNPGHAGAIENKCLSCHAPLGMHEERMLGHAPFTLAMLDTSRLGLDGVSCLACHMQDPDTAGHRFSGDLEFDSARVWGPYTDEQINPAIMQFFVGFTPDQGSHILDGRVCAGCHTLITNTIDLNGDLTGQQFVEQATWQEWKNSIYDGTEQNCRGCHLPRIQDSVILASEYIFLSGQSPFGKHHLAGGNTFMLRLLKEHREALGIPATATQFDSTIARTLRNLHSSVDLSTHVIDRTDDTAFVEVRLVNRVGHKFPSGYPSRRAFVQLVVLDATGDTLFQSGRWDATNEVHGHDAGYEPHHDVITQGDQVQIYELVMGDVNGDVTTVLERAATPLKDNRLVPQGFSTAHPSYDTTVIAGVPPEDLDFNHDALGIEGNGGDIVHYHIPLDGYTGLIQVKAKVYYQPVPPLWNAEMFGHHGAAIDAFRTMYEAAEGTPELVAADSINDLSTGLAERNGGLAVFPNPTSDGTFTIAGAGPATITAYDAAGKRVPLRTVRTANGWRCTLPGEAGVYHVVVAAPASWSGERLFRVVRSSP